MAQQINKLVRLKQDSRSVCVRFMFETKGKLLKAIWMSEGVGFVDVI